MRSSPPRSAANRTVSESRSFSPSPWPHASGRTGSAHHRELSDAFCTPRRVAAGRKGREQLAGRGRDRSSSPRNWFEVRQRVLMAGPPGEDPQPVWEHHHIAGLQRAVRKKLGERVRDLAWGFRNRWRFTQSLILFDGLRSAPDKG